MLATHSIIDKKVQYPAVAEDHLGVVA